MNRRGFLTSLFQVGAGVIIAPQIVTHGLGLSKKLIITPSDYQGEWSAMDIDLYNQFPYYLAQIAVERKVQYENYAKLAYNRRHLNQYNTIKAFHKNKLFTNALNLPFGLEL